MRAEKTSGEGGGGEMDEVWMKKVVGEVVARVEVSLQRRRLPPVYIKLLG